MRLIQVLNGIVTIVNGDKVYNDKYENSENEKCHGNYGGMLHGVPGGLWKNSSTRDCSRGGAGCAADCDGSGICRFSRRFRRD